MKTMTCRMMGGMCDEKIVAGSREEMLEKGMEHLEEKHPEMAAQVKSMPKDDPMMVAWQEKFDADYGALPTNTQI